MERTRSGKGVKSPGSNTSKLKALSKPYIVARSKFKGLSGETSPATSNLTLTGAMLGSIEAKVKKGELTVSVVGADNVRKAIYVSDARPFAYLSKGELTQVTKELERLLKAAVDKVN